MLKKIGLSAFTLSLATLGMIPLAQASGDWKIQADAQGMYAQYSGSSTRKNISSEGVLLRADYLDSGGFTLGTTATQLQFKATTLTQQGVYASANKHLYLDALPGVLTLRMDGHYISNNDVTGSSNRVKVYAPQVSFLNYRKSFYADLGYAYSSYPKGLSVSQLTPTLGLGFNQAADWLQMRVYWVKPSNAAQAQNISSTTALESKWTHWFAPSNAWIPQKMDVGALFGQRIYAVDGDAAAVYNIADVQQGSISLASQWRISESAHLMLAAGNERYRNKFISETYDSRYIYLDVKGAW